MANARIRGEFSHSRKKLLTRTEKGTMVGELKEREQDARDTVDIKTLVRIGADLQRLARHGANDPRVADWWRNG